MPSLAVAPEQASADEPMSSPGKSIDAAAGMPSLPVAPERASAGLTANDRPLPSTIVELEAAALSPADADDAADAASSVGDLDAEALALHTMGFSVGIETRDMSTQSLLSSCLTCDNCLLVRRLIFSLETGKEFEAIVAELAEADCLDELYAGWAPLHWLATVGRSDAVLLLLRMGADVAVRAGSKHAHETALHTAARKGHRSTCAVLIASGAPLAQYDDNGLLPLHVAALCEVLNTDADFEGSIAQQLIHAGANPWALTFNRDQKKPFELANADWQRPGDPDGYLRDDIGQRKCDLQGGSAYFPGMHEAEPIPAPFQGRLSHTEARMCPALPTDSLQPNNKMHLHLKAVVTPNTEVFSCCLS